MNYIEEIHSYEPQDEQEKGISRRFMKFPESMDIRTRVNPLIHLTSSAFVLNPEKTKTLMVYHNIYDSWSWTGGHGDGMEDICWK